MKRSPEPRVKAWLRAQPLRELATTTITVAEIRYGLARLGPGHRRSELETRFQSFLARGFLNRVFAFDAASADAYGEIVFGREKDGRPLEGFDGLIAAVAQARGAAIATRNVRDFEGCGVTVLNPWED